MSDFIFKKFNEKQFETKKVYHWRNISGKIRKQSNAFFSLGRYETIQTNLHGIKKVNELSLAEKKS